MFFEYNRRSDLGIAILSPRMRTQIPAAAATFQWGLNAKTPVYRTLN